MPTSDRIDNFFAMHSARSDRWRDVLSAAQKWATGQGKRAEVEQSLAELTTIEEFHAYPGVRGMGQLREKIAAGDAAVVAELVRKISDAILTGVYAHQAESGEAGENGDILQDVLPSVITGRETRRPYFEVLFVSPQPASRWPAICAEIRRLRRPEELIHLRARDRRQLRGCDLCSHRQCPNTGGHRSRWRAISVEA